MSVAFGHGLQAASVHSPALFSIQAKDRTGCAIGHGGANFLVQLHGASCVVDAQVLDHKDGTYSVSYLLGGAGIHRIFITLDEENACGGPFSLVVHSSTNHNLFLYPL